MLQFAHTPAVIAMVHVRALPGTPRATSPLAACIDQAVSEARRYQDAGVDALIVENMHDAPYLRGQVGPEITAAMTAVTCAVAQACDVPVGVQILAAANREAVAVALAGGARFVRVENFTYAHVADEGLMAEAEAGPLLRYRRAIGAEHVAITADIKKKHASHAITADVPLAEAARTAAFCGADAVIVTGTRTGSPADIQDICSVHAAVDVPVWVGSGITAEQLPELWPHADGLIVGSSLKRGGDWREPVDPDRLAQFMGTVERQRTGRSPG